MERLFCCVYDIFAKENAHQVLAHTVNKYDNAGTTYSCTRQ
jgi:hypothetical protein